jgi:hypothetical protein
MILSFTLGDLYRRGDYEVTLEAPLPRCLLTNSAVYSVGSIVWERGWGEGVFQLNCSSVCPKRRLRCP